MVARLLPQPAGENEMKRLAIYAHYDAQREVKRYVTYYLAKLAEVSERVDFVSTAGLPSVELDKTRTHCERALTRPNVGYDFGMWKRVLDELPLDEWDEVVLTNSSVFGPVFPLRQMFDAMADADCDFWGATDNYEMGWHLQSYFLVFRRSALASEAFARFWASMLLYEDKDQVIRSYELGLSTYLVEAGLRGRAYLPAATLFPAWPLDLLIKYKRRNPTTYHPVRLLRRGLPFIKTELLRDNPGRVPLAPVFRELDRTGYDRDLIQLDRPARGGLRDRVRRMLGPTDWQA